MIVLNIQKKIDNNIENIVNLNVFKTNKNNNHCGLKTKKNIYIYTILSKHISSNGKIKKKFFSLDPTQWTKKIKKK